jgi:drug/metabolite transporter (DMT)-like permease
MDTWYVAAALLSAVLHAGWNAAIKASARPTEAMAAQMVVSALIVVPLLFWTGLPALAAWPWIAASTLMNVITITALLRAYEFGGFGAVYPVVRAISVLCVVPLAAWIANDRVGPGGIAGVILITVALILLGLSAHTDRTFSPRALLWILVCGLSTAGFILCDANGVRQAESPFAYGCAVSITNALVMCWRQRNLGTPWRFIASEWKLAAPAGLAAVISYILILWVYTKAPIAPASALRDTSAVFAILIAIVWLKEPFTPLRILAVLIAAAAVPLLRLA